MPPAREWFWRLLALLMLVMACWVGWVAYQVTPKAVFMPAAYEALTASRASDARNVQHGAIRPAHAPEPAATVAPAAPLAPAPVAAAKKPPVDLEKLRLADTIGTPVKDK
jgi:hypothetical protein